MDVSTVLTPVIDNAPPQTEGIADPDALTRAQFCRMVGQFSCWCCFYRIGTSMVKPCIVTGPVFCIMKPGPSLAQFTTTSAGLPVEDLRRYYYLSEDDRDKRTLRRPLPNS